MFAFPAVASEDVDPALLEQFMAAGSGSEKMPASTGFMDDEDTGFADVKDVFGGEDEPALKVPALQKVPASDVGTSATMTSPDISAAQSNVNIRRGESLSENLQKQQPEKLTSIPLPDVKGTWVDKLTSSMPPLTSKDSAPPSVTSDVDLPQIGGGESLTNMVNQSRQGGSKTRSNASVFDISGIMLRMNPTQAEKAMLVRGFKKVSQAYDIPNFIRWRNEETCRNNSVVGYERVMNCVVELAKKNNQQYVSEIKYSKFSTKEEIEIKLTSNFTNNKVYYIMYKSLSGHVSGSGAKAAYLRNIKIYDFWKKVNQKYGTPDNKEEVSWGLGNNQPYLKAATGFLLLEDSMLRELDYTRMSREDQRFMNTDLYSF